MKITTEELQKVERLLDSSDQVNIDLGLTILSGFTVDEKGIKWLFQYYQQLQLRINERNNHNLQSILIGTSNTIPTKASRVLTLIFEKAPEKILYNVVKTFLKDNTLNLPQLDLTTFPTILLSFPNIEALNWQYGQLTHLSEAILKLPNLKTLDVRHQPLTSINESIVSHPNLKELWIGNALIVSEDLADNSNFEIFIEAAY